MQLIDYLVVTISDLLKPLVNQGAKFNFVNLQLVLPFSDMSLRFFPSAYARTGAHAYVYLLLMLSFFSIYLLWC